MNHPINEVTETTMQKIRELIGANTIVGEPIIAPDATMIVPVSKVSAGFASGGSDFDSKGTQPHFGGGSGGGVTVTPVCFLIVQNGNVRILPVAGATSTQVDRLADSLPGLIDKIAELFKKDKKTEHRAAPETDE